jgi:hypothetical protein
MNRSIFEKKNIFGKKKHIWKKNISEKKKTYLEKKHI